MSETDAIFNEEFEQLRDPRLRHYFMEIVHKSKDRGWALVSPKDIAEFALINRLRDARLIDCDSGDFRAGVTGLARSEPLICELTDAGRMVASLMPPATS